MVNEPNGALIVAVAAPSMVSAPVGVIVIGVAGAAKPNPSLMVNTFPSTPAGKFTATATGPGTCTLTTSSVVPLTATGVATATLTAKGLMPLALIVIVLAPVPVVGATVIPAPASIEVGLFVYDTIVFLIIVPWCILH